ncbi:hypothetical protein LTR28_012458, partial [Elasticomyces elasticus]
MLSAFTARPIVEFKQRDKSKIEALLTYGLHTGSLRIYRVNDPSHESAIADTDGNESADLPSQPAGARAADLLREEEKFSRRPVNQLAIIKEANIL